MVIKDTSMFFGLPPITDNTARRTDVNYVSRDLFVAPVWKYPDTAIR